MHSFALVLMDRMFKCIFQDLIDGLNRDEV